MSNALTKRQHEVLEFCQIFIEKNGYSPSFQEIGGGLGLSSLATVHKHLTSLERKGKIQRDYNRSRSIEVKVKQRRKFCPHCAGAL